MTAHPYPGLLRVAEALEPEHLLLTRQPRPRRRFGVALAMAAGCAGLAAALLAPAFGSKADTPELTIVLPPPMPMELVSATRGERAAMVMTGATAQAVNASLPFAAGAIETARPFVLRASSVPDESRALHCLTQAVYYEAGFEPVEGRRAVAQVVLNRVRHPAFPNSVCGVVYDGSSRPGCQFSFTCDGSLRRAPSPAAWAVAERVAREALRGDVASAVGHATHYHANYVAPYWAPRLTKLRQIGAHIFYRWPGQWGRSAAFRTPYAGSEAAFAAAAAGDTAPAAALAALAEDPTDRRAPEDVGGRLDVTKGWSLSIPAPAESRGRMASLVGKQTGIAAQPPTPETTSE